MRKKITSEPTVLGGRKKKRAASPTTPNPVWKNRLLLHLESTDPNLLDKETLKLYNRIRESGAVVQGPVPLPVHQPEKSRSGEDTARTHRRLFKILSPTGKTITLLEKLSLSGSVSALVQVEEEEDPGPSQ
jgi:small subunit ribosomal protein S10